MLGWHKWEVISPTHLVQFLVTAVYSERERREGGRDGESRERGKGIKPREG